MSFVLFKKDFNIDNPFIFLLILIINFSCVSTSHIAEISPHNIIRSSAKEFQGNYSNQEISANDIRLWNVLNEYYPYRKDTASVSSDAIIKLHFDKNKLTVSAIENNIQIDNIEIKARLEGDYLSLKRKFFLIPIPFFWFHKESKVMLGIGEKGNLIVKSGAMNDGWLLIMAGGNTELIRSNEYERLNIDK